MQDPNYTREAMKTVIQAIMELEASPKVVAERYERESGSGDSPQRLSDPQVDTSVGTIEAAIPKLRKGSYFRPSSNP